MVYAIPGAAERARLLPDVYARMIRFGCLAGEVYAAVGADAEALDGVALWMPPNAKWSREHIEASGMVSADPDRRRRLSALSRGRRARMAGARARYDGSVLVPVSARGRAEPSTARTWRRADEWGARRADAEQVACYLETENERNVAFYRKQGFDVIVNGEEAGMSGVRFWSFSRTPKPAHALARFGGNAPSGAVADQREYGGRRDRFPERVVDVRHESVECERDQIAVAGEDDGAGRVARGDHVEHAHDSRLRVAPRLSAWRRVVEVYPRALEMRSPVGQFGERERALAQVVDGVDGEAAGACDWLDSLARAQVGTRVGGVDAGRCVPLAQAIGVAKSFWREGTREFIEARSAWGDWLCVAD